jgi:hypothetical protein
MSKVSLLFLTAALLQCPSADGFQAPIVVSNKNYACYQQSSSSNLQAASSNDDDNDNNDAPSRRAFLSSAGIAFLAGMSGLPQLASAGIDITGLRVDGRGSGGNADIASQLKAYDGSGSARVRDAKAIMQETSSTPMPKSMASSTSSGSAGALVEEPPMAVWAYRANPGMGVSLARAGALGNNYRYNDNLVAPAGSKRRSVGVEFEFPSDWLQLDRQIGGVQYVDQRNGDKLYLLRAPLPADTTLATVPKSVIGGLLFDPKGSLAKSGQTIEDYKVSSAQILSDCPNNMCATRRRFRVKYATVTGNGLRVERRALVDAYQVENDIYMLMTSSNAVKFEQKDSRERETVENIVASFQIDA